jgi:tetratricopeptide (TPR) repeat protein
MTGRRAIGRALLAAVSLAALSLSSCGRLSDYARVVEGNRLHERGDYQGALVAYLGAKRGVAGDSSATVDYDVANAYARLGEYAAATELYGSAQRGGGREISADSRFNEGYALYERGLYEEAWKAYRSALSRMDGASPSAAAARRNLELAWRAWKKSAQSPPRTVAASTRGSPGVDESEQQLLQRLETGRWRAGPAPGAPPSGADY